MWRLTVHEEPSTPGTPTTGCGFTHLSAVGAYNKLYRRANETLLFRIREIFTIIRISRIFHVHEHRNLRPHRRADINKNIRSDSGNFLIAGNDTRKFSGSREYTRLPMPTDAIPPLPRAKIPQIAL